MLTLDQNPNISTMFPQSRNAERCQDVIYVTEQEVPPPFGHDMQSGHTTELMQTSEHDEKIPGMAHMALFSAPRLTSFPETSQTLQKAFQR